MANQPAVAAPRPWLVLAAVAISGVLAGLDGTAVLVAAPEIAQSVHATQAQLQWVANAYLVALAVGLLPAGRLADRFGARRIFIIGVLAFGVLSLSIGLSGDAPSLIALRAAQGLAGALMQPASMALLRVSFPSRTLNHAIGTVTAATAAAAAGGPLIAGTMVEQLDWPSVFLLNTPLAVLTAALAWWGGVEFRAPHSKATRAIDLLRLPNIRMGILLVIASYFAIYGLLFVMTLYLQNARGLDAVTAGVWMLPLSGVVVLSAPLGGALIARFGPRWPAAGGMALLAIGLVGLAWIDCDTTMLRFAPLALFAGLGVGLALVASTQVIVASAPPALSGLASGVQQTFSQLGGVVGIVVLGHVLTWDITRTLGSRLDTAGLPTAVLHHAANEVDRVAQGLPLTAAGLEGAAAKALLVAGQDAFLGGLNIALLIGAAVAAIGGVIGLKLRKPHRAATPDHAGLDHGEAGPDAQRLLATRTSAADAPQTP